MFVDEAEVQIKAGKGGDGQSSFRKEKYVNKGGPDGGDGGKGGDVLVRADNNVNTLANLRYSSTITAEDGEHGKKRKARGKSGEDHEIKVPVGTVVYDGDSKIADLTRAGETVVIARGGKGGFGNAHFTTSTRQAPRMAELGESGDDKTVRFELKTVADVGLVGLPNAGKSTLLSVISNAKPQIADYPFTTLEPSLGVVDIFEESLIFADIPGLISGASQGKGLGDDFLRHIERTKIILHMIDSFSEDVAEDYRVIQQELSSYIIDLTSKPQVVALTKIDTVDKKTLKQQKEQLKKQGAESIYAISSTAHKGLDDLLKELFRLVQTTVEEPEEAEDMPTITLEDDPESWRVEKTKGQFVVHGKKISRFAEQTDFSSHEAVRRLRDIMRKQGIERELQHQGIDQGDTVVVGGKSLEWK